MYANDVRMHISLSWSSLTSPDSWQPRCSTAVCDNPAVIWSHPHFSCAGRDRKKDAHKRGEKRDNQTPGASFSPRAQPQLTTPDPRSPGWLVAPHMPEKGSQSWKPAESLQAADTQLLCSQEAAQYEFAPPCVPILTQSSELSTQSWSSGATPAATAASGW